MDTPTPPSAPRYDLAALDLYPQLTPAAAGDYARPLQLLARSLTFVDPLSGEERRFESDLRL